MKTVTELKQERQALLTEAEGLLDLADSEGRALNADEQAKYDAAVSRVEEMNSDIGRRMKLEAAAKPNFGDKPQPSARRQPSGKPEDDDPDTGLDDDEPQAVIRTLDGGARTEIPRSYGKMVAFPKTAKGQMQAYRAGMWLYATLYGNVNAQDWCRKNGVGVRSALAGGVNTAGGALVPEEFERAIIDLREEFGMFRRVCRVMPMGSDTRNVPRRVGGLTATFVGEGQTGTSSDASWDNVQLVAKKLMVLTRMSSEVSEDAIIDLADTMAQEIAYAFAIKEDGVGFNGTGSAADGGIVGVLVKALQAGFTKAKVAAASTHDTLGEINSSDLIKLMAALPQFAKRGSAWYCSPTAQEVVFNAIKIAGGGNTADILSNATRPTFLGYPIEVSPVFPDDSAATYNGLVMIAFGNLRQAATMGERRGIRVALSNEQYWEQDQIGIKGTERFDININDLGSTTVKPPFAVLVGTT